MRQWWETQYKVGSQTEADYKIDDAVLQALTRAMQANVHAATIECKQRMDEAEKDRQAVIRENHLLVEELEQSQAQTTNLAAQLAERQGAMSELRERLDVADSLSRTLRDEIARLGVELSSARDRASRAEMSEKAKAEVNAMFSDSERQRAESEARLAEALKQNDAIQHCLSELTARLNSLIPAAQSTGEATRGRENLGESTAPRRPKRVSAAAAVVEETCELIRQNGPMAVGAIRSELVRGGTHTARTLESLAAILSKNKRVRYSRAEGRWFLVAADTKVPTAPANGGDA